MKTIKVRLKKLFVFLMTFVLFAGTNITEEKADGEEPGFLSGYGGPVRVIYAAETGEEKEEDKEEDKEENKEEDKEEETGEDSGVEEEEADGGSFSVMSASNGIPSATIVPQRSDTDLLDYQIVEGTYEEYNGNTVTQISWGIDTNGDHWQDLKGSDMLKLKVNRNCVVTFKVKAKNGFVAVTALQISNVDSAAPEFQSYSDGQLYKETLLGTPSNSRAKSVKVEVNATDSGLGMADKAYACTSDSAVFNEIKKAGRDVTDEQLAKVEWQESNGFEFDENGKYYIMARDKKNLIEFLEYSCECIDKEAPQTTVTQEFEEVEGHISENRIIASSEDVGGAGLAEKPYSWNSGERTDDGTFVVKENCKVMLDVYDALENKEHVEIEVINHLFDTEGPKIRSVTENSGEVHNSYTGNVWLKVDAADDKISLAEKAYSFDGGESWQAQSVKNVTTNGRFNICVRDALMNVSQSKEIDIYTIDDVEPIIDRVRYSPQGLKGGYAKNALITVEAEDGQAGLSSNAYAFDGGAVYQTSNTYLAEKNGVYDICVRDAFRNTAKRSITVSGIDCTAPVISVTGNPASAVYKAVTLNVSASDTESGIASIWYKNDLVNIPSAIYQSPDTAGSAAAKAEAVINVNGDYTFYAYDALGNVTETKVSVTKITKKATQKTGKDTDDSDSGSGSSSGSSSSRTIVLPPSSGSSTTTQLPVAKSSEYTSESNTEASSGKTIVLKGSASSNTDGDSQEEGKSAGKKSGDFELEFEETPEGEEEAGLSEEGELPDAPVYEGGLISVENTEHESVQNEAAPAGKAEVGEVSEKLLMSAAGEKEEKSNTGVIVLICVSAGVIAAGGATVGVLIKRGILKIPDFFEEKE